MKDIPLPKQPIPVILGTDWWSDCDDCMALRILCWAHKKGYINLLGVCINACMEYSVASVDAFLHLEGLSALPIGLDADATDFTGRGPYQQSLAKLYSGRTNADAQDGVALYRRLLSTADRPVHIVEIGFTQVLADLLDSAPDDFSPLNGKELVREKCAKLWCMAGDWSTPDTGREHNFCNNARSRSGGKRLCEGWSSPITFLGFEIGVDCISGGLLQEDDFLHMALAAHGSAKGRCSWDPMLALLCVVNDEERAGYSVKRGTASLDEETGVNRFALDAKGQHQFVCRQHAAGFYSDWINAILTEDYHSFTNKHE